VSSLRAKQLIPQHQTLLKVSAIRDEVARARGYWSATKKAELAELGFGPSQQRVPALVVPVWGITGEVVTYQARPDHPRVHPRTGKLVKYETPAGARMVLDVPPAGREWVLDPTRPLFITEGVRKADSAVSHGLACVALLGVWNWRGSTPDGKSTAALPDWELVPLKGRQVYIAFDSDAMLKPEVHEALVRLKGFLELRGADVALIYLPPRADGGKQGLDDFFASGGTVKDLLGYATREVRRPQIDRPAAPRSHAGPAPDGAKLLRDIEGWLQKYVVLPEGAAITIASWVLHTHLVDVFLVTPYLLITSPERRCGKTLLLSLLHEVVARPLAAANISESALFRVMDAERCTLLYDEAQALRDRTERSATLHDLLCAGHRRGQAAIRMVGKGAEMRPQRFDVYGAKAVSLIGRPTDVLLDRGIEVRMKRRAPHEQVERFRIARVQEEGADLRARIEAWASAHREDVARAYETAEPPGALNDRARDNWTPLFAVVAVADPSRLPELEQAALHLSGDGVPSEEESVGVRLLLDIRRVFTEAGVDRFSTERLLGALAEIEEAPWGDWHGRRITPQALARLLRPFGIRPDKWREGDRTVRGYALASFEDAFARYLPSGALEPPQPPHPSSDGHSSRFGEPPQNPLVADTQNGRKPQGYGHVADVAVSTPGMGGINDTRSSDAPMKAGGLGTLTGSTDLDPGTLTGSEPAPGSGTLAPDPTWGFGNVANPEVGHLVDASVRSEGNGHLDLGPAPQRATGSGTPADALEATLGPSAPPAEGDPGADNGLEASFGPLNRPDSPLEGGGGYTDIPLENLKGSASQLGPSNFCQQRMTVREPDGSIILRWGDREEVVRSDDLQGWRPIQEVQGVPLEIPQVVRPPLATLDVECTGLDPETDRLLAAGLLLRDPDGQERTLVFRGSEREILEGITQTLLSERPRIIITYNGLAFDFPFLAARARALGVEFPIELDTHDRVRVSGTAGVLGKEPITFPRVLERPEGLPVVDVFGLVARFQNQSRTLGPRLDLKSVASALGVAEPGRLHLPHERIPEVPDEVLEMYLRSDLRETLRLFELLATPYLLLAKVTKLPLEDVVVRGAPWVWEALLERHYKYRPEPDPKERYEGGLVLCRPGLYRSCIKVDVHSLYPHAMLSFGIHSRKDPDGHMLSWLRTLLEERLRVKARAKVGDPQAKIADSALKLMLNSAYGFLGSGYPFNDMRAAAAVTAYGRKLLTSMVAAAEDAGGIVVAADTDGVVLSTEEPECVLGAITAALPDPFKVSVEWSGCTVFASDPKNYQTFGPQGELVEARGAKWRGSDREALWTKFPLEFLRRLTMEGPDSAFEYAREVKRRIESGNAWELVTRSHRVSGADKTLLSSGYREGALATYVYKVFKSSRKEIARSPAEGYDVHHYVNVLARVVGEIAEVCGLEVPEDLRPTKRTKHKARVAVAPGTADGLGGGDQEMKLEDAVEFLRGTLGSGPRAAREVLEAARSRGISKRTLARGRNALGVESFRERGRWWWRLPDAVKERVEPDELLRAQGAAEDLEDGAPSGGPVTERPLLGRAASEVSLVEEHQDTDAGQPHLEVLTTEGGQVEPGITDVQHGPSGAHGEALDPLALAARLERTLPGPRHLSGDWILSRCPNCNRLSVAWSFRLAKAVSTCDCLRELGLILVPELPVRPLVLR
jgi:DNA polymerase I